MFLLALGVLALSLLFHGVTFSILWEWFIVSKFGLPSVGIVHAMGIVLIVELLTTYSRLDEKTDVISNSRIIWPLVFPILILAIGWVVHLLI